MERRDFLKQAATLSAGLAGAVPVWKVGEALAQGKPSPILAWTAGRDYGALVDKALAPLGGMGAFVQKGMKVVVKPNIAFDRTPPQAGNTHPEIVKALVMACLAAGAKEVKVFDRPCNDERRCYANSGIKAAVESIGDKRAVCEFMDERKFVPVKIAKGKSLKEWDLYKDAVEADCYINAPIAKHHNSAKLTLGLKNVMGVLGGIRGRIHVGMAQNLADLATVIRPQLTVIDATRILLRNGPSGGNLKDVKILDTLIASPDPVAADAYAATLFNLQPKDVAATVAAYNLGLGEMDLGKVKVVKV